MAHPLPPVRAVAVMAPTHRLARQAAVRPSDLQGEALIAPLRSTRLRARLEESLARAGVEPDLRAESRRYSPASNAFSSDTGARQVVPSHTQALTPSATGLSSTLGNGAASGATATTMVAGR